MKLSLVEWLQEREANCRRHAARNYGAEKAGWLEDADYFKSAAALATTHAGGAAQQGAASDDESCCAFTPAHSDWEARQTFRAAIVGSWPWLRGCINGIPKRQEFIGGQRTNYVALDEVLGWIDEGERRATPPPSQAEPKGGNHG